MYLQRLLEINVFTLVAFGALLLGMGQRSETLPLVVVCAAGLSIWLTDVTGWFRLGRRAGNIAMLIATAALMREMFPLENELQIFAIGRFLVFLQVTLLFQQKDARIYWLLIILSLLQVVVATSFSQGLWFGVLLVGYLLLFFFAMTLLLLYRQWMACVAPAVAAAPPGGVRRRWPLFDEPVEFTASPGGNLRTVVSRELLVRIGLFSLYTFALTSVMFFIMPRFSHLAWRGPIVHPQKLVGFTDKVTLGELGSAVEDRSEVMRVWFYDASGNIPYPVRGEIYFRGAVLTSYHAGQWSVGWPSADVGIEELPPPAALPQHGLVRQRITLEGLDREELFYVAPYVALEASTDILLDHRRERLLRPEYLQVRRFQYELGTTALVQGRQLPLVPSRLGEELQSEMGMSADERRRTLPHLVALADRWIKESGLPASDRVGRARCLERHLADATRFHYSLQGQPRDQKLDPLEDFIALHPTGHCEYFASALVLMLRSQGIPARLVLGYKCDEWNQLGGYYQVRQWHAHAWAEAYLEPAQLPQPLINGRNYWPWETLGGWLQLDPTPGAGASRRATGWRAPLRRGLDWLDFMWANYVMEMNHQRQRDAIYQPLVRAIRDGTRKLVDGAWWQGRVDALVAALRSSGAAGFVAWLLFAVSLTGSLLIATLLGWWLWRNPHRWLRWMRRKTAAARHREAQVQFYRRLETILARQGLVRAIGQTQREFARAAGAQLAQREGQDELAALLEMLTETFYRVRFGGRPLDGKQAQIVEHALGALAAVEKWKAAAGVQRPH